MGDDGTKLSKRHGAVSVMQYRDDGYLPEALLNYLVRLGWGHGDQEIFTMPEMIELFSLDAISKSASAFNTEKLRWVNNHYIKTLPASRVAEELVWQMNFLGIDYSNGPKLEEVVTALAERSHTLREMAEQSKYFYQEYNEYDPAAVKKWFKSNSEEALERVKQKLEQMSESDWVAEKLHAPVEQTSEEMAVGMGKVGMPLRIALTGLGQSPEIGIVMQLIGKERCLKRIDKTIAYLKEKFAQA